MAGLRRELDLFGAGNEQSILLLLCDVGSITSEHSVLSRLSSDS